MSESGMDILAGKLLLSPGRVCPHNLQSTRPDWVGRLTPGLAANRLADVLGNVFSLCRHAHRLCASSALAAARGNGKDLSIKARRALQLETLREHLHRICLDWPQQLSANPDVAGHLQAGALTALRRFPMPAGSRLDGGNDGRQELARLDQCLQSSMLGMPGKLWLQAWEADPAAWLDEWSSSTPLWLPALLHDCKPLTSNLVACSVPLRVHASQQEMLTLAANLGNIPQFSREPRWQQRCAETGTWTRLNQPDTAVFKTPWMRLGARVAELVRLCLPDEEQRCGAGWLQAANIRVAEGQALAWVEMARGLLIHHVQLESAKNPDSRIAVCHVIAPTEWNFHPHGVVAQALAVLPRGNPANGQIQAQTNQAGHPCMLMAAFDPCVRFELDAAACPEELAHA